MSAVDPEKDGVPVLRTQSLAVTEDTHSLATVAATVRHSTACSNCRSARQRCDRLNPCKPDTVEKLLLRISESPVGDQVVRAILDSAAANGSTSSPSTDEHFSRSLTSPNLSRGTDHVVSTDDTPLSNTACYTRCSYASEPQAPASTVSPLDILASAVSAVHEDEDARSSHQQSLLSIHPRLCGPVTDTAPLQAVEDQHFVSYFASQPHTQTDWQVLSSLTVESIFKIETAAFDPVAARLIDENDASFLFGLFFKTQNPLVGLLDEQIHTADYVYATSFTLFSVVCSLGCRVSSRSRDRVIYPSLLTLAERSIRWSIASSVCGLEIIQALILMQCWAPARERQANDPYWLHLSHAAQLAKQLGIHKPDRVDEHLNAPMTTANGENKERFRRNYERTWLYIFIADKSFGVATGRCLCVSWDEMPTRAFEWWQNPLATPHDRLISGIVECRGIMHNAFKQRNSENLTPISVIDWHLQWFKTLEHVREVRCTPDDSPSSLYLPLLSLYMDHNMLVLSAQAVRTLAASDTGTISTEFRDTYRKIAEVANRMLDTATADFVLKELKTGLQNNQFIMICHAVAEIALKRNILPTNVAAESATKVRSIPAYLHEIAQQLPSNSMAQVYASASRSLIMQLGNNVAALDATNAFVSNLETGGGLDSWPAVTGSGHASDITPWSFENLMFDVGWTFHLGNEGINSSIPMTSEYPQDTTSVDVEVGFGSSQAPHDRTIWF
ncbi:hypothetical protein F5883DRAFT_510058 [Diaporthe sp. PMI_573]|nr:hypothetical protein F5883DRAFT_510058 [Diaporthaceae sp. PMI_573]